MTKTLKSRAGFVVIKVRAGDTAYYLLRANPKWKDVNLLGGHEKERDAGDLKKAARRELWEEVPLLRKVGPLLLEPLTDVVHYGPIHSQSQNRNVEYELQFFLLKLDHLPDISAMLRSRTRNVLVAEKELPSGGRVRVSGLISLLDRMFPGGLNAIPYSSSTDLGDWQKHIEGRKGAQLEFSLK
jgi:8-oxo-dGTP pyrophosphatase MutT (NUDIX family)